MTNVAKFVLPLVLVAGAAGAVCYFLSQPATTRPATVEPGRPQPPTGPATTANDPLLVARSQDPEPERVDATGRPHADAAQGVKGRVLLPDGAPAADVPVLLMRSLDNPIDIFLGNVSGRSSPPLASTVTDRNGAFVLGLRNANQTVDLRVASDRHPELSRSPLKVRNDEWVEVGDLALEQGLLVQGRVLDLTRDTPVAGATVFLNLSSHSHAAVATPGRERGVATVTDQAGYFRFENGPRVGLVDLTTEAAGYADGQLRNQQLRSDTPNEFRIGIEPGRQITGIVVDDHGARIPGVRMKAVGISSKTPQTETVVSDGEGEFVFAALREGPYRLTASARDYADVENPLVVTDEDVTIVLASRGSVKLKVLTSDRRAVKTYGLSLKRTHPNDPDGIGNVFDYPDRRITPRDHEGDWAIVDGLPSGSFRFQLTEPHHAKTLSPVFTVREGTGERIEVIAVLTEGASITGTVIDDRGQPVPNALVASDLNTGLAANIDFFDTLRKMMPEKHTSSTARTDDQGRFRIDRLSFADYMVRVSHESFCEGTAIDISLQSEGDVVDAGVIQLTRGAIVEGTTAVAGKPSGQIKVVVSMPTPRVAGGGNLRQPNQRMGKEEMQAAARQMFSASALSDADGNFRLLKRIPPGTYKVTAARHSRENPFATIIDMKETEQELVIAPGQDRAVVRFDLARR